MRFLTILITIVALGIAAESPAPPPTAATKKKSTTTPVRLVARSKAPARGSAPARKAVAPARQAGPTPDRYRQIQESLISKGYLQGAPTGVWDQNSVDAMKRFQNDQKLEPTGKITSKALINLGLGPSDESAAPPSTAQPSK
jgi:peptidoglycan hydrolase-like protein with peptidoglycan-binding domain